MFIPKEKQLMYAAMAENIEKMKYLVEKKNVSIDSFYKGKTPLIAAAAANLYRSVLYCLARGADVDAACKHEGKTALMHAVVHGHLNIVETLLNNGSNVHAISKNGSSVMELAVEAAKQTCPTHDEHVQWCTDASKCTFHKGRAEIVNLIENIL